MAPAFEAFVESKLKKENNNGIITSGGRSGRGRGEEGKDGDSKLGIPMTKKKFAELELSLLHCKFSSFLSSFLSLFLPFFFTQPRYQFEAFDVELTNALSFDI